MNSTMDLLDQLNIGYGKHKMIYDDQQNPVDYLFLEANETYASYFACTPSEMINKTVLNVVPRITQDSFDWIQYFGRLSSKQSKDNILDYSKTRNTYYNIHTISEGDGIFITLFVSDKSNFSSDSISSEESIGRIELLNRLLKNPKDTVEAVLDQYMNAAIELTDSQIGYLYFYDDKTKLFTLNNWSNGVMDVCSVTEPRTTYELEKTGIWGEVVRQRKPIIINDYQADNPLKKGIPEGHAPLQRWMSIPIWDNDDIVGVLGLANKQTEYDELDLHEVDILMKNVWTLVNLMRASEELTFTETLFRASMESQDTVVMIDRDYKYLFFNKNHAMNMRSLYNIDVKIGQNVLDNILVPEDAAKEKERYDRALMGASFVEVDIYGIDHNQYYETKYSPILINDSIIGVSIFTTNITERMNETQRVKDSEEKFRLIYSTMSQGLAIHEVITNDNGQAIDYRYIEVNDSYLKLFGFNREDIIGKRIREVAPDLEEYWIDTFGAVALSGEPTYYENYSRTVDKYLAAYAYSPKPRQFAVLISDITNRIEREREIEFLSYNDQLTGLYNRRYYEETLLSLDKPKYYPLSVIVGDVNGLKLVNDSFGHQVGDQLLRTVADILRDSCRNSDVLMRIGGDEFVILLPNTNRIQVEQVVQRIRQSAEQQTIKSIEVSISFGFDTKTNKSQRIQTVFKSAEDDMYRNKIVDTRSMRSRTVDLIINTLFEKNEREMFHSRRVSGYCEALGKALSLDEADVGLLKNAGLMHDIGKIGITDNILNKKTFLLEEERLEVEKHSEIGYRILSSIPEFSDIAQYILEHHERFDGTGYPNGLSGSEITLQARAISVADAYDAMTGPRPYKPPVSKQYAIEELKRCSGSQFDPYIVDLFINQVLTNEQ